jgi:hypothetical protein
MVMNEHEVVKGIESLRLGGNRSLRLGRAKFIFEALVRAESASSSVNVALMMFGHSGSIEAGNQFP